MRKALSVMAVILIASQGAFAGDGKATSGPPPDGTGATIEVLDARADPQGSVQVQIAVYCAKGYRAMHVELEYDPSVLALERVADASILDGALFVPHTEIPGHIVLSIAGPEAHPCYGTLADVFFKVVGKGGVASDIVLKNCKAYGPGEGGEQISVAMVPGRVTIAGGVPWIPIAVGGGALLLLMIVLAARRGGAPVPVQAVAVAPGAFCPKCGVPLRANAQFCEKCGSARS